jgi:hypothetical protein
MSNCGPKVAHVETKDAPQNYFEKQQATVTLDNGRSGTAHGTTKDQAIERATANANSHWFWGPRPLSR